MVRVSSRGGSVIDRCASLTLRLNSVIPFPNDPAISGCASPRRGGG
jgi:hypothetical protein